MQTFTALLAPWSRRPLHPAYETVVGRHLERYVRLGGANRAANETTCPYCGHDCGMLLGFLRVGGKQQVPDVWMTREGYDVPDAGNRSVEIQMLQCPLCGANIEEIAYTSPIVFYEQRTGILLLTNGADTQEEEGRGYYGAFHGAARRPATAPPSPSTASSGIADRPAQPTIDADRELTLSDCRDGTHADPTALGARRASSASPLSLTTED